MAPVLSPDEKRLYVCNRFDDDVSVIDVESRRELKRIKVEREPVAAAMTPDGRYLVVGNHLHTGAANSFRAEAVVSVMDTAALSVAKRISLGEGASLTRGVEVSPDGRFAAVTHLRSLYWLSTTSVELGRMNCNALTILDMFHLKILGALLLDQTRRGAANPWAVTWLPDGKTIAVSHAGTHEVSLIDAPTSSDSSNFFSSRIGSYESVSDNSRLTPQHPVRVRQRVPLPGNGPRAMVAIGSVLYVANYFSDDLCRIDLACPAPYAESLEIQPRGELSVVRRGEMLFNDARLCFESWQSCASCHDADARADALNWDLLNDGIDNPKNTKTLVWAHQTAPAMALGVRTNAEQAVRAGIHHILFTQQPESVPDAIDAWLKSLQPLASPRLSGGAPFVCGGAREASVPEPADRLQCVPSTSLFHGSRNSQCWHERALSRTYRCGQLRNRAQGFLTRRRWSSCGGRRHICITAQPRPCATFS